MSINVQRTLKVEARKFMIMSKYAFYFYLLGFENHLDLNSICYYIFLRLKL